ncbi:DUF2066 domain-containing protein [Balneatrix alpica]|uniref:DUF2066 domain-containing protein n=1 Tax=Balneatrix alpica TaxID=75684 RepID=UPI00273A4313|nr:DUF2066 domain-containing protein [Balneatrix alpica]
MKVQRYASVMLLLCLLWSGLPVQAVTLGELYHARIEVAEQTEATRQASIQAGLQQVLLKVLGRQALLRNDNIQTALERPESYLLTYHYQNAPAGFELVLEFDANAILTLLKQAGLAAWGDNRPAVLLWLAVEEEGARMLVGEHPLSIAMQQAARDRGVPLYRPLLDLQDELALDEAAVWGFFAQPIQAASERYRADQVLVGRVYQQDTQWHSQWQLLDAQGRKVSFSSEQPQLEQIGTDVIAQLAEHLAGNYGVYQATSGEHLALEVAGMRSFSDWQQLERFLQSLSIIESYQLEWLVGDSVRVKINTRGDLSQLEQALALERRLQQTSGSNPQVLRYFWQVQP